MKDYRIVLGLGSNLGDRASYIARAIEAVGRIRHVAVVGRSPLYESEPAGGPPQGDYLNGAVLIRTPNPLDVVLRHTLQIERDLGRVRSDEARWGPRVIDIDLLWAENEVVDEPGLIVPHPRLGERPFALRPLLDVVPEAWDPVSGVPYADLPAASLPLRPYPAGVD